MIATGGLASLVVRESETARITSPDLTLIGLRLVFEKNAGAARVSRDRASQPDPQSTQLSQNAQPDADLPEQMRVRASKLERLTAPGHEPYPVGYPRTTLARASCASDYPDLPSRHHHRGDGGGHRPGDAQPDRRQAVLRDPPGVASPRSR